MTAYLPANIGTTCGPVIPVRYHRRVVAAVQLVVAAWAIYKTLWIKYSPNPAERWAKNELEYWFPPGADGFLYIAFAIVIAKLVVGILLWKGIEKGEYIRSKNYILAWLITNTGLQAYIIVISIYLCGYLQYYRLYDIYFMNRGMMVGVWFGVVDMVIMFWAIICVTSFYQQLEEHEFGTFKRTKRALWHFDLGMSIRSGASTTMSRPPSTAYSFQSLAVDTKPRTLALDTYGVNSSAV